jgi:hypothetical protein
MNAEFLGTMQLASDAMSRSVDPNEILQYFSWWAYVAMAVGYTVFVFLSGIIDKFVGFGRRNQYGQGHVPDDSSDSAGKIVGPFSRVMLIHGLFLLILLGSLRIIALALPYLPHWMSDTFGEGKNVHTSVADYIGLFAVAALAFIERRRLCSKPKTP